jgi:hypothetical protein
MHPTTPEASTQVLVWHQGSNNSQPATPNPQPISHTPLPDIYAKSAPMLRCSDGRVSLAKLNDSLSLHLAFFEWNDKDSGSVLEAFRHLPEVCMGSIGVKMVSKEPPRTYQVDGTTLTFDHTIFREPGSPSKGDLPSPFLHAFRAVWVASLPGNTSNSSAFQADFSQLRSLRFKCALNRYRPSHARVIQAAVHGAPDASTAWSAFETALLKDLRMEIAAPLH